MAHQRETAEPHKTGWFMAMRETFGREVRNLVQAVKDANASGELDMTLGFAVGLTGAREGSTLTMFYGVSLFGNGFKKFQKNVARRPFGRLQPVHVIPPPH